MHPGITKGSSTQWIFLIITMVVFLDIHNELIQTQPVPGADAQKRGNGPITPSASYLLSRAT